jgi:predicted ATPase/DNA-binding SARP family transcriptional activator
VEFSVLGPLEAQEGDRSLPLGRPKQRAVLAALLMHAGEAVPRDRLIDELWGDEPPGSAVASLQVYVHGLRQALGAERIETRGQSYRLHVEQDELDLERFERLVARAEQELAAGRADAAAARIHEALALWRGPALADLADEPVARAEAGRLEEQRLHALELRNDVELALGRHAALASELEALVAEHPYRDRLRQQQVLALYRSGRQKEALEAYQAARHALVEELGIEPSPELRELERAILRQDPTLAPPERPEGIESRVPAPPTPLVGRGLEVAAVTALLRDEARLVTLTGPGGTGKTRLALAAAEELSAEMPARFVDLSPLRDPELVPQTVAQALGLQDEQAIGEWLGPQSLLLVLDNFEQLLAAAPFVAELLAAGPGLRVLATSRAPLRLSAEHEYPVPPLPLPAAASSFEEIVSNDAVRLFAARARAVDPGFQLTEDHAGVIAAICKRLDGLPLALELAAARSKLLPPEAMAGRLERSLELLTGGARDLPARQQTLEATLDWSHELLEPGARALFAQLAVFRGGWTLEDAEAVSGRDVVTELGELVDESLVRRRNGRFTMLETIREYASRRLGDETRRRHAEHFLAFAEKQAKILSAGTVTGDVMARLDAEHDNLRGALAWAAAVGEIEIEVRLAAALRQYWIVRGELSEARRAFEGAVERSGNADPALRALAHVNAGLFPYRQGDLEQAKEHFTTALGLYRRLGDEAESGRCLAELGAVAIGEGDLDRAEKLYVEAVEHFRTHGQTIRLCIALGNLGALASMRGDYEAAARFQAEVLPPQREIGDRDGLAISLHNFGRTEIKRSRVEHARELLGESLELATELGYKEVIAYCLQGYAQLALEADPERAARLVGASLAILDEMGVPLGGDEEADYRETHERLIAALGEERVEELIAEGRAEPRDAIVAEAPAVSEWSGSPDPAGSRSGSRSRPR